MHAVVTSFGPKGYEDYAHEFLHTFRRWFPAEVRLLVYHEGTDVEDRKRQYKYNLLTEVRECADFLARHEDDDEARGRSPNERWKSKAREEGYYFRFDAHKFCRKVFALRHAKNLLTAGKMYWIDADVVFTQEVTVKALDSLLPDDYCVSYLGRSMVHSECGFVGYNLNKRLTHELIDEMADLYAEDRVFDLEETHDSYVFDWARERLGVPAKNLTPHVRKGSPWESSPLSRFSRHDKGQKKYRDSRERVR